MLCVWTGGEGGGDVTSIQSGSYVAWCDQHFRGICKWKKKRIIFPQCISPFSHLAPRVLKTCWLWKQKNEVLCKDACINPLNHFPAPLSLLCYLRLSATGVQRWNEGFILLWEVPPTVMSQRWPHHANQKRIYLKGFSIAAHLMLKPSQRRTIGRSALARIKVSAKLVPLQLERLRALVHVCV